jgi:TMEM175 potassium channel family protein
MEKARLEAFSDGVFAVAITLLALDLAVAGPGHGSLTSQLGDRWPSYAAYVVSFFTIGITWVNHHALFKSFAIVDRMLLFLNLTLLLFIVAIPFGTATMAAYLRHGGNDAHVAAAIYAGILEGMSLSFSAIFVWSVRDERRRHEPLPPASARSALFRFGAGALVYLVVIAIAFVSAPAALVVIALVAVYYVFEQTPSAANRSVG